MTNVVLLCWFENWFEAMELGVWIHSRVCALCGWSLCLLAAAYPRLSRLERSHKIWCSITSNVQGCGGRCMYNTVHVGCSWNCCFHFAISLYRRWFPGVWSGWTVFCNLLKVFGVLMAGRGEDVKCVEEELKTDVGSCCLPSCSRHESRGILIYLAAHLLYSDPCIDSLDK